MKTVILCGGMGTRLAEETSVRPKPMVTVGGYPILWHIMNLFGHHGMSDFLLAIGYKGDAIKEYFLNYHALNSDFQIDLATGKINYQNRCKQDWKVNLIDTGLTTLTGGRLLRLKPFLESDGTFMLTYGDGVANIDIKALLKFHKAHGKLVTVTAVKPNARFGGLSFEKDRVTHFKEKPQSGEGWINGGFFVMEPGVFEYLKGDQTVLEGAPMESLVKDNQLMAYQHTGFWQCMDTLRDRQVLEENWASGKAPWKVWRDVS